MTIDNHDSNCLVGGHTTTSGAQSRARSRRCGQDKNRQQFRLPGHDVDRFRCVDVLHNRTVCRQQVRSASDQNRHSLSCLDVSILHILEY